MHESGLAYALAIFVALKDLPDKEVYKHLDANLKSYFKKARKFIYKHRSLWIEKLRDTVKVPA